MTYGNHYSVVLAYKCTSKHVYPQVMGVGGFKEQSKCNSGAMLHDRQCCIINVLDGTDDSSVRKITDPKSVN